MVILHDEEYYRSRVPTEDLGPLRNFERFIWDPERKAFLGRTAKEWGQLGLFYLCFFAVLGTIFAVQMKISVDYVSKLDKPFFSYTASKHFFGLRLRVIRAAFGSPGIVFKPTSMSLVSPIIFVSKQGNHTKPKRYINSLSDFLQGATSSIPDYHKNASNYDLNCQSDNWSSDGEKQPCFFDIKNLGTCGIPPYGYTKPFKPCVLIKFNKRFDWTPEYYNYSSSLPLDMPEMLKNLVQGSRKFHIWLSCDGANNVDKEHIGELEYIPGPGFPVEYFPFTGQQDYLSPIVALKFKNLTPNRLITVECNLWAFNIKQRSRYSLDFQIMIDD